MQEINCGTTSCQLDLGVDFWNEQWISESIGWDIGYASPAIANYFSKNENKEAAILIPGCGNAYEAEFLLTSGYKNITLIDIAPKAAEILQEKFKNNPEIQVICEDFFVHERRYDFIVEQTFFCAIPTLQRKEYVKKVHELLNENGKLVGLLFNKDFEQKGPPFGGSIAEYQFLFRKNFDLETLEICENSIPERENSEVFIEFRKK